MSATRSFGAHARCIGQRLVRLRCLLPFLAISAACLLVREQYPFSHFPMYSSFSPGTDYVYIADGAGKALPSFRTLGISTATLKKMLQTEVRLERLRRPGRGRPSTESKRVAAERLLARFRRADAAGRIGDLPQVLRLYEVRIRLKGRELMKETTLVAQSQ